MLKHKYPQSWVRNPNVVQSQQVPKDSSEQYQQSSQMKDYNGQQYDHITQTEQKNRENSYMPTKFNIDSKMDVK